MSGIFNFKTGVAATDIVVHNDTGGTIDGIDLILDALQAQSEAANIQQFQSSILQPLGINTITLGATYSLNAGLDTFTVQMRKNTSLYDLEKINHLGQAIKYIKDQTIDKRTASTFVANAIQSYAAVNHLVPAAPFITTSGAGNPILHYTPIPVIVGSNVSQAHIELFQSYLQKICALTVVNSINFAYSLTATFNVEVAIGTSDLMNTVFSKVVEATVAGGTNGTVTSFYDSVLGTVGTDGLLGLHT